MNNINSVEHTRSVVTDTNAAKVSENSQAAKSGQENGKALPSDVKTQTPVREAPQGRPAEESAQKVEAAVEQLNDYVQSLQRDLRFSLDNDLGRAVVHVIDRNTDEVIRQIPNETALRLARNLKDQVEVPELQDPRAAGADASLGLINTRI